MNHMNDSKSYKADRPPENGKSIILGAILAVCAGLAVGFLVLVTTWLA
jgi:hypothetical protein